MTTQQLINTLNRYDKRRKVKSIHRKLTKVRLGKIAKKQNISKNELNQAEKPEKQSIDELKEIPRLRRIKDSDKLTKDYLIIRLLKSESSALEHNFLKHFNNNKNNNSNTDDNDTYDDKIRGKISDIRLILSRLGNMLTKNGRRHLEKRAL